MVLMMESQREQQKEHWMVQMREILMDPLKAPKMGHEKVPLMAKLMVALMEQLRDPHWDLLRVTLREFQMAADLACLMG